MNTSTLTPTSEPSTLNPKPRPRAALILAGLLLAAAGFMALLGLSASAYYYSACALLLAAGLMFFGKGRRLLLGMNGLNQLAGVVLILTLWLGDGLGVWKLNIAGIALLLNVLTGGPLMSILGGIMVVCAKKASPLHHWMQPS